MLEHVSKNQDSMFRDATANVRNHINAMCEQIRASLRGRVRPIYLAIARDYKTIVQVEDNKDKVMGKAERLLRKKVDEAISRAEVAFKEVLEGDSWGSEEGDMAQAVTGADVDVSDDVEDATVPLVVLSSDDGPRDEDDEVNDM